MSSYPFFAMMARLKLIRRWSLMRNTQPENDAEHSLQVAMMAHCIATLGAQRYGRDADPDHAAMLAIFHDATEVLTGDLPTPVKYGSAELRSAYRQVEDAAAGRLLHMLPETLRPVYGDILTEADTYPARVVKAADRISAYVKCLEEQRAGNREFDAAARSIRESIDRMDLPEALDFMREFVPAFELTLDELNPPAPEPAAEAPAAPARPDSPAGQETVAERVRRLQRERGARLRSRRGRL